MAYDYGGTGSARRKQYEERQKKRSTQKPRQIQSNLRTGQPPVIPGYLPPSTQGVNSGYGPPISVPQTAGRGFLGRKSVQTPRAPNRDFSFLDILDRMRNKPMPGPKQTTVPDETATIPMFGKSLDDYLAESMGGINPDQFASEQLAMLDAREKSLRGQAQSSDEQLAKIYAWLVSQIQGQDPQINQQYSQAQQQTRDNMQSATNAVVQGGRASGNELAAAFKNLGIEPAAGTGNLAAGQQNAIGGIAQRGQVNADYMANTGVTQRNLNRSNATAAGFRGAEERAAMQRDLARYLAELDAARGEARSSGAQAASRAQQEAQEMALRRYQAERDAFNDDRSFGAQLDNQAWTRAMDQQRLELSRQEAARRAQPPVQQPTQFDQISSRLQATQGRKNADLIMQILAEEAQNSRNLDPATFAAKVHRRAAQLGPSAALEAHAAAEQYWQAFRD